MSRKPRILFFDSGMGGLSHLKQVENTYFDFFDYYFLFDNELFPYSERPDSVLIEKLIPLISRAIEELEINLVVIACNTASTLILDQLREKVKIPVIGVVPALKPAVEYLVSKGQTNKAIGLLATKATIARPYVLKLIEFYTEPVGHNVSLLGTTDLVEYVEAKIRHKETNKDLRKILAPWLNNDELNLGVIVLACTHFPLVKDEIQELFPNILLIDTCFAIARRIGVLYGFFKKKEIEAQRKEFIDYLNKIKLESHEPVNNKHLLSTKLLTEAEFNELKGQGFADYTCFPHQ
ncbi:glutamate racemase [Psittacicella melopsittaci]|uniref:Glutamate racemase n=1 Tax=Psittacicella melopsittaci TaxID=2028576 RepID=A0A3A1Y7A4_9GAMM|nr:glutamate racemase [Psittacicella melopsittaci]RIY32007.1 glutamate racemase [Psittacicella melopsittaci]